MDLINKVPFGNLRLTNKMYFQQVLEILDSGQLIGGEAIEQFEDQLSKYLHTNFVITVASGTDALFLALKALDIRDKARVLVANNAGGYGSIAALNAGYIPIFFDVHPDTFNLDLDKLEKINPDVDVLIATHLYGKMIDMPRLMKWANSKNVLVIEDCAQSLGAEIQGRKAGTFGHLSTFSFYPTKNLGGIGDGGAVATSNQEYATQIRKLKQYGWNLNLRYDVQIRGGINSRLDSINANVLREKLPQLDHNNQRRRIIKQKYTGVQGSNFRMCNSSPSDLSDVAHLAVGVTQNVENFSEHMARFGIQTARHYPIPDSMQQGLGFMGSGFETPVSKFLCSNVVSIPIYPELTEVQVSTVVEALSDYERI
jgi:dTDP-4-amino-4,6-dideoxygalactose transaminase